MGASKVTLNELSNYELRHLTSHITASGGHDKLYQLLWLKSRRNQIAWYEAKDRVGDLNGYIFNPANIEEEFLNDDPADDGTMLYHIYHTSFQDFLRDDVGLLPYHARIAATALSRIPGLRVT